MKLKFFICMCLLPLAQCIFAEDLRGDTVDLHAYQLKLDLRDFDNHILYVSANIGIKAKVNGVGHLRLDLLRLNVDSVRVNGISARFTYDDSLLDIHFSKALDKGDSANLLIYYHGKPGIVAGDFGGFYWDDQYAFNIGVSFLSEPHSYGRAWFPCFDNFKVRSYYEFFVTTRKTEKAFCNGTLVDVKTDTSSAVLCAYSCKYPLTQLKKLESPM